VRIAPTISEMKSLRLVLRQQNSRLALVPTMGALHTGHISLIRRAKENSDKVVVSIFVNPTQFGPTEDFDKYPRSLEDDVAVLKAEGVDALFLPTVSEMYPGGFKTFVTVEELSQKYCGQYRPGHFRGVTTVVLKLFNSVQPDVAVFGQKDAQQCLIIQRMVRDLNLDVEILVCPTIREIDGVAVSSRNRYLSPSERKAAGVIYRSLQKAEEMVRNGERNTARILEAVKEHIWQQPLARLQYVDLVNSADFSPLDTLTQEGLLLLAVFIGSTRLIDNISLRP
jgi:pantoate--beta-alanine ligase